MYGDKELYKHLSDSDDELLAEEIWVAARTVLDDIGEDYTPSGAKLMEMLFEYSMGKSNMWYVNNLHWLLNIGQLCRRSQHRCQRSRRYYQMIRG